MAEELASLGSFGQGPRGILKVCCSIFSNPASFIQPLSDGPGFVVWPFFWHACSIRSINSTTLWPGWSVLSSEYKVVLVSQNSAQPPGFRFLHKQQNIVRIYAPHPKNIGLSTQLIALPDEFWPVFNGSGHIPTMDEIIRLGLMPFLFNIIHQKLDICRYPSFD